MRLHLVAALSAMTFLTACAHKKVDTGVSTGDATLIAPQTSGPVPGSEADLVASVGDRVLFPFNQSGLTQDAQATLLKQAAWLAKYPQVNIEIAGNCDDRGTEEYNIALGQRRANAARDFLVAHGVASSRITTISYGKDRPTDPGDDESAWAQNRNAITSVK